MTRSLGYQFNTAILYLAPMTTRTLEEGPAPRIKRSVEVFDRFSPQFITIKRSLDQRLALASLYGKSVVIQI